MWVKLALKACINPTDEHRMQLMILDAATWLLVKTNVFC